MASSRQGDRELGKLSPPRCRRGCQRITAANYDRPNSCAIAT